MTQTHAEFLDLCAVHALDSLDVEDEARLERHLSECVHCTQALADFREDTLLLSMAVAVPPSPAMKARVMNAIREPLRTEPIRAIYSAAPVVSAPAALHMRPVAKEHSRFPLLFGALGWVAAAILALAYFREVQGSRQITQELVNLETRNREVEHALTEEKIWADSMSSPSARVAEFTSTWESSPTHEGWALFDPQTSRAIIVFENLAVHSERDYEVWAMREGGQASLGVLRVEPNGRAFLRLQKIPDSDHVGAFAISLETKGGSSNKSAPSGPVVMVGTL